MHSMSGKPSPRLFWPLLALGLVFCMGLGLWMQDRAREEVRAYGQAHVRAQGRGMLLWLYDNPFLVGKPLTYLRPAPRLHKDHTPRRKQRPNPFSWRWLAMLEVPADGRYIFDVYAAEAVRLRLNGRALIQEWIGHPDRRLRVMADLKKGAYLLDLENVQERKRLDLTLMWTPPRAGLRRVIPDRALRPLDDKTSSAALTALYRSVERWRALTWLLPLLWLLLGLSALRDPARTWRVLKEHRWFLLALATAALARLLWADVAPGVSGEEAYFGHRAALILEGGRPFNGMTERTGPLFDYLLVLPWAVFGPSAWLLRVMGVIPNLLALVFCYRAAEREAGRSTALAACLLLAVIPALVIFARMPGDNTSLGPLMFFMGLDMLSMSRRKPPWAVAAGIVWGLASFNHSIFLILPFSLGLAALVVSRLRVLGEMRIWGMGFGFLLGFAPRILDRLLHQPKDVMSFTDPARMKHLGFFLKMFASTLDGQLAYLTFVGRYLWETYWAAPAVFGLAVLLLCWGLARRRDDKSWIEVWLMTALVVHLVMTPLGAPTANTRYFLYCCIFAALIMGRAWGRCLDWSEGRARVMAAAGLIVFAAWNAASLGVNYFYAHLQDGGRPHSWGANKLLDHTSDAWMNHKLLVQALVKRGYPVVATTDFWHHTLYLSLNLYQGEPLKFSAQPYESSSDTERAAVFYNSPEGKIMLAEFMRGHSGKKFRRVSLGPELDKKYLLYERVSPPVNYPHDWEDAQ